MLIGYYIDNNINKASSRIRYLNIIRYLKDYPIEIYDAKNHDHYKIILFGKKFSDNDVNFAKKIKKEGKKLFFDICDNYFYNPKNLESYHHYKKNILTIMELADQVILSSKTLFEEFTKEVPDIANKVSIISDAYETNITKNNSFTHIVKSYITLIKYWILNLRRKNINLIWFGNAEVKNAEAGILNLEKIRPILEKYPHIHLTIISNNKKLYKKNIAFWPIKTTYLTWNNNIFHKIIRWQDATLIPISINNFTKCKTNNRLVESIVNNVDVIADKIPSYEEFEKYCFLDNWQNGLEEIIKSKKDNLTKQQRILAAKRLIEKKYSISQISNEWRKILFQ